MAIESKTEVYLKNCTIPGLSHCEISIASSNGAATISLCLMGSSKKMGRRWSALS